MAADNVRPEVVEKLVGYFCRQDSTTWVDHLETELQDKPTDEEEMWAKQRFLGMTAAERTAAGKIS